MNTLQVEGMTCGHCAETVKNAVNKIKGVNSVEVDLENKLVRVDLDEGQTGIREIAETIRGVGFETPSIAS